MSTLEQGLSVVARVPNRRAESYLLWSMGDLQRDRGAFDEAQRFYNKALELLGNSEPSLRCAILVSGSTLQRWQGQPAASVSLAKDALTIAEAHHIALEGVTSQAALWTAQAQSGETGPALKHLEAVVTELRKQGARFELVWAFALGAHVALLNGSVQTADHYLQSGLRLAQEVGSSQPLAAEIVHTPLLEKFVVNNYSKYGTLVQELKKLRDAQVETSPTSKLYRRESRVTYSLRVWTLGREQIERDGELIPTSEWRSTSAREMFLYLLFAGPKTREQISLDFWPDGHPRQVRNVFHTTLYRSRHALGENVVSFQLQEGLYQINPDLDLWCDAQEMESLIRQARLMPPRDARTEDLWSRAAKLYHGDFLPSWDTEWVGQIRQTMQDAYLEALIGLGDCVRARSNPREAISVFRRALDVDPYREDVYRAIMNCYAEMGEKKQILAHLQKLQELLWEELGIGPSEETLTLASTLLH
jgi:DNA-binding SARP family transcriptional activator